MIYPYVKNIQIFECPSQPDSTGLTGTRRYAASYGYSGSVSGFDNSHYGMSPASGNSVSAITRPSEVVMFFDSQYLYNTNTPYGFAMNVTNPATYAFMTPHMDGTNIAFVDGHVKWSKTSQIVGKYNDTVHLWDTYAVCMTRPSCLYSNPAFNPTLP